MAERALQIAPYPRHVTQILRFAVAHVEARKNAEDLAGALRGERRVDLDEAGGVEVGIALTSSAHVTPEQRQLGFFGNADPRVLQQRCHVIGRWPDHRVLKIKETKPRQFSAARQPQQIGRMEVAQNPVHPRLDGARQTLAPEAAELIPVVIRDGDSEARQKPIEDELCLDQERVHVIRRNAIVEARRDRQHLGQLLLVQGEQHVDSRLVALLDRDGRIAAYDRLVAEVFNDEQPGSQIGLIHGGRGESVLPQSLRHGNKRYHVIGETRDLAIGLAIAHRRAVETARRVHQNRLFADEREAFVRTGGGVAFDSRAPRPAVAALGNEPPRRRHAIDARRECAKAGDAAVTELPL